MYASCKKSKCFATAIVLIGLVLWAFGVPGSQLAAKPSMVEGEYTSGWAHGCQTGTNSYAPLRSLITSDAFVKDAKAANADLYKNGWNEGFTVCRFTQEAWFNILALLFIVLTIAGMSCRSAKTE